jgi:hypothetical protein
LRKRSGGGSVLYRKKIHRPAVAILAWNAAVNGRLIFVYEKDI